MLLDWLTYNTLILIVLGWGLLFWKCARYVSGRHSSFPLWGEIGYYGLFTLGILSTLFNFFSAINLSTLVVLSLSGVVLFFTIVLRSVEIRQTVTQSLVLFSLAISFFLTLFSTYNTFMYDAGLYHLPHQVWMRKEPVVLGLANLNTPFGYNSILEALSAIFWLPNRNFVLVSIVENLFFLFFYLTLLEFLLRRQSSSRSFSLYFALFSPLSILLFDDYVTYGISNTDSPAALAALLSVFSFLRIADRLQKGENVEAEFLSLHILAALAFAIKISCLPVFFLVASAYWLLFRKPGPSWSYIIRIVLLSLLILIPTVSRNLATSGCFVVPIDFTCLPQLPWSASHLTKGMAETLTGWSRAPGPEYPDHITGWGWLVLWGEKQSELIWLLIATTIVIFACAYFGGHRSSRGHPPFENTQGENTNVLRTTAVLLVIFEVVALAFWFFTAPDIRYGTLPLHMLTMIPAFVILSKGSTDPHTVASPLPLAYTVIGIAFIVFCILKISDPTTKRFMHRAHLFNISLYVPEVETVPTPPYGVHPVKPDDSRCWLTEEPCSPWYQSRREFEVGRIGPFKAFVTK